MIVTTEQQKEFKKLTLPLIRFLNNNFDPYVKVIVDTTNAEILGGSHGFKALTTETEGREDCPVIASHCEFYGYQCDSNGEIAICYCAHKDNPGNHEGNCTHTLCPITSDASEEHS